MLSSKHGVDSPEHCLAARSQLTDSLTTGAVGLVFSSVARQARPASSLKSCSSGFVLPPELQPRSAQARAAAMPPFRGRRADAQHHIASGCLQRFRLARLVTLVRRLVCVNVS